MTQSIAFFLSPDGHIVHVPLNHIGTVMADPETFGLTRGEIQASYHKHGEAMGVEGQARREILLKIISEGWIRIRRYGNHWSVTAPPLASEIQEILRGWAKTMLSGTDGFREVDRYMPVKVSTLEGELLSTIGEIADGTCPW